MLVIKGATILVTGYQPPLIFEISLLFLGLSLLGLHAYLRDKSKKLATSGLLFAYASLVGGALGLVLDGVMSIVNADPGEWDAVTSMIDLTGGLGPMLGLVFIGLAILRSASPWRLRWLPLVLGWC